MIPVLSHKEEAEKYKNKKEKSAIDIMYDSIMKDMRYLEQNVGRLAREDTSKNTGVMQKKNTMSVAE